MFKSIFRFIFLLFITSPSFSLSGQQIESIKGILLDGQGEPLMGNAILLAVEDQKLITGTSFLDGTFQIENIQKERFLLKFTSLLFQDTILRIEYNGEPQIDLGHIIISDKSHALETVTVKARRPSYIQKSDGTLEINIENTTLSASNSVDEILTKSPNILVGEDGSLSVLGKGEAIVYVNGKRITNEQLSLLAPSNIKKLEIIRNPSSKYDAEGAAVIHIHTIQNRGEGYQIGLKQNISHSSFGGTNTQSTVHWNFNKKQFSLNSQYSILVGKERERLHTTRDRDDAATFLRTNVVTDWQRKFDNSSNYGLGMQYDLASGSYVSLEYAGSFVKLGGNQISENMIRDSHSENFYDSNIDRDEKEWNHSLSLNYNQSLDTLGSSFFLAGQYSRFNTNTDNDIDEQRIEQSLTSSRNLKNQYNLGIDIYSGQLDYSKVFHNNSSLELGLKTSYVDNHSNLNFFVWNDTEYLLDNELSNYFNFDEWIGAAYIQYKGKIASKWQYSLGLRGEYTNFSLDFSQLEKNLVQDDYFYLFPNVSINRVLSDQYSINFSYSSSIRRPPYHRMNPVLIYQDPYTSIQGNPDLVPQKVHAFEFNTKLNKTSLILGYKYSRDPFGARVLRGDGVYDYVLKPLNYDRRNEVYASVSRTFTTKWWTSQNTVSVEYLDIREDELDVIRVNPKPRAYFYTKNTFDIANLFNLELMYWYVGDSFEGVTHRHDLSNFSITIEKAFLDNRLKCRLIAHDIFDDYISSGTYQVGGTDIYFNRRWSQNYFRLSMIYNFGKLKKATVKNKAVGASENQRAM